MGEIPINIKGKIKGKLTIDIMADYNFMGCISWDDGATPLNPDIQFTANENFTGFGLNAPNGNSIVVDWGDSTTDTFTGSGNLDLLAHTYSAPGSYTVKVTVTGATEFKVNYDDECGSNSLLTVDVMQSTITTFNVGNNTLLTSINTTELTNCTFFKCISCTSLTTLDTTNLTDCIELLCNGCSSLNTIGSSGLASCTYFKCDYCILDVTTINNALINLDTFGINAGNADLSNQTPAAPPSGAGATAAVNLIGKGWTVTTD